MSLKDKLDIDNIPTHVAIIMDGNGRWAKEKGQMRLFGHATGVESVREALTAASEIKVEYLTLYAFSTENWNRPKDEVDGLMDLLDNLVHLEMNQQGRMVRQKFFEWKGNFPQVDDVIMVGVRL